MFNFKLYSGTLDMTVGSDKHHPFRDLTFIVICSVTNKKKSFKTVFPETVSDLCGRGRTSYITYDLDPERVRHLREAISDALARSPRLHPGQKFAVHASIARPTAKALREVARKMGQKVREPIDFDMGAVVGVVEYRGVINPRTSRWFAGPIAWRLVKSFHLQTPVPCAGQLGLWRLPKSVTAEIARQLRHSGSR